jgi:hypothetical protein
VTQPCQQLLAIAKRIDNFRRRIESSASSDSAGIWVDGHFRGLTLTKETLDDLRDALRAYEK